MTKAEKVELDTDDVKEEDVTVSEKAKEEKPEKIDVDLGYTDPIQKETKAKIVQAEYLPSKETKEEKQGDDLQQVSEGVQKRIDQLTRRYREAERREKAALDYAKGLQAKAQGAEKATQKSYIEEFEGRVDAQREQVKASLQEAIDNNDAKKIMEANDKLTQLSVEKEKAKIKRAELQEEVKQDTAPQTPIQEPPLPSAKAERWASENAWFGSDRIMTNAAYGIHQDLVEQGFDPESDEYYNEVNKRMQDNFPQKFATERRPVQTVASAGRKQEGRRTVKLTRSQVAIAKKLGVPLEEYAKHVKE